MLTRFMLIASVLLVAYSLVMVAVLFPWAWLAIGIGVVYLCKKQRSWHAFGTARWADINDLWARGMVDGGNGPIVGQIEDTTGGFAAIRALFNPAVPSHIACQQFLQNRRKPPRKLVRLNNAVHTAAFIPTGGGKGVSLVIPHLLTCPDSMIVLDYKGDNARISSTARQKMKNKIVLLDPMKSVTQTPDTCNPLEWLDPDSPVVLDDCRALANALVIRTGQEKDPHWNDSAELWITAMIAMVVAFAEPQHKSLQTVRDLLTNTRKMQAAIKLMCESTVWGGMLARMGHQLTHYTDKELSSTLTTTNRHLRFLDTPAVYDSTKTSSFNPAMLRDGKMTVYLIIPPEHMTANTALLRMWIVTLLRAVVRGGLQEKNKVHVILDEAASLGHMDIIDDAVDKFRGYGIRLFFLFQSLGQTRKNFPDGQEQTFLSNVTQIFAGVNDNETAKYVSERLGKSTIVIESGGTGTSGQTSWQQGQGGGSSSYSSGRSSNDNWQQSGRELLQASEVMNLDGRIAIVFTPGVRPLWTTLVRYYERSFTHKRPGTFWPAVKRFCYATIMLLIFGCWAVCLTLAVNQKCKLVEIPAAAPTLWQPK